MSSADAERRKWPRIPAEALSHITASVVAGPAVKLVNLSRGGALMEVASRFPMRSRVRLKLTLATGEVTVAEGLVAWAKVAAIVDKQVNYLVAIIFDKPIPDLGGLDAVPIPSAPPPEIVESPRLTEAVAARDNLSQFPVAVPRAPERARVAETWSDADEQVVSLEEAVELSHASGTSGEAGERVTALAAANDALLAQLAAAEAVRNALLEEVQTERRTRDEERARLLQEMATAAVSAESLQSSFVARDEERTRFVTDLAEQQQRIGTLQAALAEREQEHARAVAQLEERQAQYEAIESTLATREQDHVRVVAEIAVLQNRLEALQSTIAVREQEYADRLAEQKSSYEALTTELLQAAQAQQAEIQLLLDEQAARRDEERRLSDTHALELARVQEEATQQREQLELKYQDVQARLDSTLELCAAQDARDRGLRNELEKLAAMVTTLVSSGTLQEKKKAVA